MLDPVADPHKMNGSETLIYSKEVITAIAGRGGGGTLLTYLPIGESGGVKITPIDTEYSI
jgi:hypothetical protein